MPDPRKMLDNMYDTYKRTSGYRDGVIRDIGLNRAKYEKHLDEMWDIYRRGNMAQVVAYKQQIKYIKEAGFTVQRSKSTGKHRIV